MKEEVGGDWGQLCDGKANFAIDAAIMCAFVALLGPEDEVETATTLRLRLPEPLGSDRLESIASTIRFADRATLGEVAGRSCVRITTDGATTTSFLDPDETAIVKERLGPLLR